MIHIIPILIVVAMGTIVAFWAQIVDLFSQRIIPWVRVNISPVVAEAIADVISFADEKIVPARKTLKASWKIFRETVLGTQTTYTRVGPDRIRAHTAVVTRNLNGQNAISEMEEIVDWSNLPESIRSEMIRQNNNAARFDVHKAVCEKVIKVAKEKDLLEVLEMQN